MIRPLSPFYYLALLAIALGFISSSVHAEEKRPIRSEYTLEIGEARNISTYLSPLYYTGTQYGLSGAWEKDFNHWSDRCRMRFDADLKLADTYNPAHTAQMLFVSARLNWGLAWQHHFNSQWYLTAGPMASIYGGALYLTRNGNNPVSALAAAGIDLRAAGSFSFNIGRLPLTIKESVRIPTLSVFFAPEFGETYYEIWLGNHSGLVHAGWWGNAFGIDNTLSVSLHFGTKDLILGYRRDFRTFHANSITSTVSSNSAIIGLSF